MREREKEWERESRRTLRRQEASPSHRAQDSTRALPVSFGVATAVVGMVREMNGETLLAETSNEQVDERGEW